MLAGDHLPELGSAADIAVASHAVVKRRRQDQAVVSIVEQPGDPRLCRMAIPTPGSACQLAWPADTVWRRACSPAQ
jgi:hypothetical protein